MWEWWESGEDGWDGMGWLLVMTVGEVRLDGFFQGSGREDLKREGRKGVYMGDLVVWSKVGFMVQLLSFGELPKVPYLALHVPMLSGKMTYGTRSSVRTR